MEKKMQKLLNDAGFSDPSRISAASDGELMRIRGFGRKMLDLARKKYGAPIEPVPEICAHKYGPAEMKGWFICDRCGDVRLGPISDT